MSNSTDEWTKLTSLPNKYEADLLAGRLKEMGIQALTNKAPGDPAAWLGAYGNPRGMFDIYVPAVKAGAARELLVGRSASGSDSVVRSYHRPIQIVGRGLILASLLGVIAALAWDLLK